MHAVTSASLVRASWYCRPAGHVSAFAATQASHAAACQPSGLLMVAIQGCKACSVGEAPYEAPCWVPEHATTLPICGYAMKTCEHPHKLSASRYTARVELSSKVVDCEDRLQRTLAHELCHVAAWLLDQVSKPPHGQVEHGPVWLSCMQPWAQCEIWQVLRLSGGSPLPHMQRRAFRD